MFTPDPLLGFLILIVLPIIVKYFLKFSGINFIIYLIISISAIQGSLQLLFNIDPNYIKWLLEFLIWSLVIFIVIRNKNLKFPHLAWFLSFLIITLFSFYYNQKIVTMQLLLFLRKYLLIFAIIFIFENIYISNKAAKNFIKLILLIFISQVIVNIIRFPFTGQTEEYIGTLAVRGGSLTTIFSSVGISFVFAAYFITKQKKFIIVILGLFLFAIIGGKRAIIIFIPLVLFFIYYYYNKKFFKSDLSPFLKKITSLSIIIILLFYFGVRLNPTLNPENEIMGSFDINYISNYVDEYLNPGKKVQGALYYGRGEAPMAVYKLLSEKKGAANFLIGMGPGDIIMSRYSSSGKLFNRVEDIIAFKYDIGYGARTGLLFTGLQIGILGVLFFFVFFIKIFNDVKKNFFSISSSNILLIIINLGLIGMFIVFFADFLFYSRIMYDNILIMVIMFLAKNLVINKVLV